MPPLKVTIAGATGWAGSALARGVAAAHAAGRGVLAAGNFALTVLDA